jgi:hypothetical protein
MIAATYVAQDISTSGMSLYAGVQTISNKRSTEPAAESNMSRLESAIAKPIVSGLHVPVSPLDCWDAENNLRYKELARDEALRELSIEELAELETLTRLRRFAKYPRSAEEILWERRQQKVTHGLVQAVQTYVEFHETPRHT